MSTIIDEVRPGAPTPTETLPQPPAGDPAQEAASRLSTEQVWGEIAKASFMVLGYLTPKGEPRASGVLYKAIGRKLYAAVAADSWKAKHIAITRSVSVTVMVRRGGLLSLLFPIPPATISFHGRAIVHPPDSAEVRSFLDKMGSLLPQGYSVSVIEITPQGTFVTYGIGVPLMKMRDRDASRARVAVR